MLIKSSVLCRNVFCKKNKKKTGGLIKYSIFGQLHYVILPPMIPKSRVCQSFRQVAFSRPCGATVFSKIISKNALPYSSHRDLNF